MAAKDGRERWYVHAARLLWPRKTVRTFYGRARRCALSMAAKDGTHLSCQATKVGMLLLRPRKTVRTCYGRARRCAPSVAAQDGKHLLWLRKTVRTFSPWQRKTGGTAVLQSI
eukprot:gene9100-biopygen9473